MTIPTPPNSFDATPFGGRWFHWDEIHACFWPGVGGRSEGVNPELARIRKRGGVYLLAWSRQAPTRLRPDAAAVKYIGETSEFKRRLGNFAKSAGIWGKRRKGHSAGWRWPEGATRDLWVAFFEIGAGLPGHLASGLRKWMEAVALEEHRVKHGHLPLVNSAKSVVSFDGPS